MSKYRKAFLIWLASVVAVTAGLYMYGTYRATRLASHPIDTAAPALPSPIWVNGVP